MTEPNRRKPGRPRKDATRDKDVGEEQGVFFRVSQNVKSIIDDCVDRRFRDDRLDRSTFFTSLIRHFDGLSPAQQRDVIRSRGKIQSYLAQILALLVDLQEADNAVQLQRWIRAETVHSRILHNCARLLGQIEDSTDREAVQVLDDWLRYRLGAIWTYLAERPRFLAWEECAKGSDPSGPLVQQHFALAARALDRSVHFSSQVGGGPVWWLARFNIAVASALIAQFRAESFMAAQEKDSILSIVRPELSPLGERTMAEHRPEIVAAVVGFITRQPAGPVHEILRGQWQSARTELESIRSRLSQGDPRSLAPERAWFSRAISRDEDLAIFRSSRSTSGEFKSLHPEGDPAEIETAWLSDRLNEEPTGSKQK